MRNIIISIAALFACFHLHAQQPNILVIFSDDHTQQTISAYGSKLMQTPILTVLRKKVLCSAMFLSPIPFVRPAEQYCLLGNTAMSMGSKTMVQTVFSILINSRFKNTGTKNYQTAWIGKWHLQTLPNGFDYWKVLPDQGNYFQPDFIDMNKDTLRYKGYVTDLISDFSLEWLNKRDQQKPFFS